MATEVPARTTPLSILDALQCLGHAYVEVTDGPVSSSAVILTTAQWALETGRGRSCKNHNFAGIKANPDRSSIFDWTFYTTSEWLPVEAAEMYLDKPDKRIKVLDDESKPGFIKLSFSPNHPACCFRAYRDFQDGALDYLWLLRKKYASAWDVLRTGDPAAFARKLKQGLYYTAPVDEYEGALSGLSREFRNLPVDWMSFPIRSSASRRRIEEAAAVTLQTSTSWRERPPSED